MADADFSATHATQILHTPDNKDTTLGRSAYSSPFQVRYPELDGRTLPPLDPVLRLLRLLHTEKQRFFIDVPVVGEQEFEEICQRVYFAVNDYSLSAWIIVNAGLYYLFLNLIPHHYSQIAVTGGDIQEMLRLLSANLDAAIQSIRLCQDPSLQWCQALSLLVWTDTSDDPGHADLKDKLLSEIRPDRSRLVNDLFSISDVHRPRIPPTPF